MTEASPLFSENALSSDYSVLIYSISANGSGALKRDAKSPCFLKEMKVFPPKSGNFIQRESLRAPIIRSEWGVKWHTKQTSSVLRSKNETKENKTHTKQQQDA